MKTDVGEYIVGAYLKIITACDVIDYNVRVPGGGLEGLNELDVIGLDFKSQTAYLCEVTTHIRGVLYKDNPATIKRIQKKYEHQRRYAERYLTPFPKRHFMFWSPVVPKGIVTNALEQIEGLELIVNAKYAACIDELKVRAKNTTHDTNNPFFRALQILEHLRR